MFNHMFKIDFKFVFVMVIFAIAFSLVVGCQSTEGMLAQAQEDHDALVCMESERSGAYAVFSGHRKTRTVIIPKESNLTKDEWLEVITKCFQSDEQTDLLQLIESLSTE